MPDVTEPASLIRFVLWHLTGGAAMGYFQAGFTEIVGVDNRPMPRYPFTFVEGDALEYLSLHGREFAAIHASPPCQAYTIMRNLPWNKDKEYPSLILPTIELLQAIGKPYVLENVMGARHGARGLTKWGLEAHGLKAGWLCGTMFGKPFYRHRLFAANWLWLAPGHRKHVARIRPGHSLAGRARDIVFSQAEDDRGIESWPGRRHDGDGGHGLAPAQNWQNGHAVGVGMGHAKGWHLAAEAMGIDWCNRAELIQAIPPCYTRHIGIQLMKSLDGY